MNHLAHGMWIFLCQYQLFFFVVNASLTYVWNFTRAMRNYINSQTEECGERKKEAKQKAAAAKQKVFLKIC